MLVTLRDPPEDEELSLRIADPLPLLLLSPALPSSSTAGSRVATKFRDEIKIKIQNFRRGMGCQPTYGPWATMDDSSPLKYGLAAHSSPEILNFDLNFISKLCCNAYI